MDEQRRKGCKMQTSQATSCLLRRIPIHSVLSPENAKDVLAYVHASAGRISGITLISEEERKNCSTRITSEEDRVILEEVMLWIRDFLEGRNTRISFPVHEEGTEFQKQVWAALRTIPRGETRTYLEIAESLGRPGAVRAVGAACGANPLLLYTPCHRVVGSSGKLGGFSCTGISKERLIELEKKLLAMNG